MPSARSSKRMLRVLACDVSAWQPDGAEWSQALSMLQEEEQQRAGQFRRRDDAARAVAGRLLLRHLLAEHLACQMREVQLKRSETGRPELYGRSQRSLEGLTHAGHVLSPLDCDFNSSHHGAYAVACLDPMRRVGIDVMSVDLPGSTTMSELFGDLRDTLTPLEWQRIRSRPTEHGQLRLFYQYWTLKEAFVKALGDGIGFGLERIEFRHWDGDEDESIRVYIDGVPSYVWSFHRYVLEPAGLPVHLVAVCVEAAGTGTGALAAPKIQHITPSALVNGDAAASCADDADDAIAADRDGRGGVDPAAAP